MEVIIAGSRHLVVQSDFLKNLFNFFEIPKNRITLIRHGDADGIDTCGKIFAMATNLNHISHPYKKELGRAGGPVRNREMAEAVAKSETGGCLVLIWDGVSKGSLSMKTEARKLNIPIFEIILHQPTQGDRKKLNIYKPPAVRKSQVLKSNESARMAGVLP